MFSIRFSPPAFLGSDSTADLLFPGLTLLFLLASWGLIILCERLMDDGK
jgi:hypothetical protein